MGKEKATSFNNSDRMQALMKTGSSVVGAGGAKVSRAKADSDLYGDGLLGESLAPQKSGELANKFMIPPFTVLSAREGWWQDRKRAWLSLGIQSELGRGEDLLKLSESNYEYMYNKKEYIARLDEKPVAIQRPKTEAQPIGRKPSASPLPRTAAKPVIIHEPPAPKTGAEPAQDVSSLIITSNYESIKTDWTAPAMLPDLPRTGRMAVDVETKDPQLGELGPGVRRPGNYVVGIAIGTDDGRRWYFPVRHEGGGNLDEALVWRWAREELNAFCGTIVGTNLAYDLDWLAENGVTFPFVECFDDIQIAEPLIDEWRYSFALDELAKDYLGERKVDTLLAQAAASRGWKTEKEIKSNLWRLPASFVGGYAEGDVDLPLRILPLQLAKMKAEETDGIWEVERRLVRPLIDMTRRGVRVDVPGAEIVLRDMTKLRDRFVAEMRRLSSPKAELAIPTSFVDAIKANGHIVPLTPKSKAPQIRKEWLAARLSDPLCSAIFNGRKVQTLISTFLEGNILGSNINGRIHCTWKQLKDDDGGTIARTASMNPNLANIPNRDDDRADEDLRDIAPLIRGLFLPEDGEDWGSADWSQIEYRLLAHFAVGLGSKEVRQTYNDDSKTDYHKLCAELAGIPPEDTKRRKYVKGLNFGKSYGARANKISMMLGCSKDDAQAFMDLYDEKLPFNKATFDACQKYADKHGFVRSILKRRQHFTLWEPRKKDWDNPATPLRYEDAVREYGPAIMRYKTYKAMNAKMQSSNADIIKAAMVEGAKRGLCAPDALGPYLLTIYDELNSSIPRTDRGREAWRELHEDVMINTVKLNVPILVVAKTGETWGKAL